MDLPYAIDLDFDGTAEIIKGNCIYDSNNCNPLWCGNLLQEITSAVANFDSDYEAEIVIVGGGQVHLYEHDGTLKWQRTLNSGGGSPTVADFNGDEIPDVALSNSVDQYYFLNGIDGSIIRAISVAPIRWDNSITTGSSSYDFQNDGIYEAIFCGNFTCYIMSTLAGNWIINISHAPAYTMFESTVITDIDLDGIADVVTSGNWVDVINPSLGDSWMSSVSGVTWNSPSFNGMNIDENNYPQVTVPSSVFRSRTPKRFVSI